MSQDITELETPAELAGTKPQNPAAPKRKNPNNLLPGYLAKQAGKTLSLDELKAGFRAHTQKVKAANERRAKYAPKNNQDQNQARHQQPKAK